MPELFIKYADAFYTHSNIRSYPDIAIYPEKHFFRNEQIFFIGIFYPSGEPISLQRLHRSPGRLGRLVVVHYNFMSYFFAVAVILARK